MRSINKRKMMTTPIGTPSTTSSGRPVDRTKDIAILQAARQILLFEGANTLTMEAVAHKAGVSKATLYSRFGNRNALIEAVLRAQSDFFVESLGPAVQNAAQTFVALENFGLRLLQYLFSEDHLCLMKTLQGHQCIPAELRLRMYELGPQATCDQVEVWLAQAHQAGVICCADPALSAELLFGMLVGMDMLRNLFQQAPKRKPADLPGHIRTVVTLFLQMHQCVVEADCAKCAEAPAP
jgi:TetR/AcrR family transcriptional repressor of mexJK operon